MGCSRRLIAPSMSSTTIALQMDIHDAFVRQQNNGAALIACGLHECGPLGGTPYQTGEPSRNNDTPSIFSDCLMLRGECIISGTQLILLTLFGSHLTILARRKVSFCSLLHLDRDVLRA